MLQKTEYLKRYGQAVQYLPPRLRGAAMQLDDGIKKNAEEFRLRSGQSLTVSTGVGELDVPTESKIRHEELNSVLEIATGGSVHTSGESLKSGFITVFGGHRIGICGTGIVKNGELSYIKQLSSVSIRIAKEVHGAADKVLPVITQDAGIQNTIIISPPGCGKTTMLRDIIRQLGNREDRQFRISVVDERSEIAAKYKGVPQFDVGKHTDVMEGIVKSSAIMLLLRSMSPQVLAVDEITEEEDIKAIERACNCGVSLIATAHGDNVESIAGRPLYQKLLSLKIFKLAIVLSKRDGEFYFDAVPLIP